jgi:hypothetical protein
LRDILASYWDFQTRLPQTDLVFVFGKAQFCGIHCSVLMNVPNLAFMPASSDQGIKRLPTIVDWALESNAQERHQASEQLNCCSDSGASLVKNCQRKVQIKHTGVGGG